MIRFRTDEFEHLFSQQALEKGFRLQRRRMPELREKNGTHFSYMCEGHQVSFHRSPIEITQGYCDCGKSYCHHFAAVMFSFMDSGKLTGRSAASRHRSAPVKAFEVTFRELRQLYESELSSHGDTRALAALLLRARQVSNYSDFSAAMAALAALSMAGRQAACSAEVQEFTSHILLSWFCGESPEPDQDVMYAALLEMLRSNERLSSNRVNALLPVFLVRCTDMFRLDELRALLNKRHLRKFHAELFDELAISRQLVHFRIQQLEDREVVLTKSASAESFVALARLHFAAQEMEEAWKVLDDLRMITRETAPLSYFDLLSYMVSLSAALHDKERQLCYIEELMLYSPYLSMPLVQGFIAQLASSEKESRIRSIMSKVMSSQAESSTDKLYVLSMAAGITDVFLEVIRRGNVRFFMVHDFFMRFHHVLSVEQISLYFRRLCDNLSRHDQQPKQGLLDLAAKFNSELGVTGKTFCRHINSFLESNALLRQYLTYWINITGDRASQGKVSLRA